MIRESLLIRSPAPRLMPFALSSSSVVPSKTTPTAPHWKSRDSDGRGLANEINKGQSLVMTSSKLSSRSSSTSSKVKTAGRKRGGQHSTN